MVRGSNLGEPKLNFIFFCQNFFGMKVKGQGNPSSQGRAGTKEDYWK